MPFKRDEDGNIVTTTPEGGGEPLPVLIDSDGNEVPYDPEIPATRLKQARDDKRTLTSRIEQLEAKLKGYEKIEDPEAVLSELEELRSARAKPAKKRGAKEEVEPGELEEQLNQLTQERDNLARQLEAAQKALEDAGRELETKDERIQRLSVGSQFGTSSWFNPYIDDDGHRRPAKTLLDPEVAQSRFGPHFRPGENGDGVVATWTPGGNDLIYSEKQPDRPANFDEAFGLLLNKWDKKSHYLPNSSPGGMNARESGGSAGGRLAPSQVESMTQDEYERKRSEGWTPDTK